MGPHSTHDGDGVGETPYYTTGYRYSRISILHPAGGGAGELQPAPAPVRMTSVRAVLPKRVNGCCTDAIRGYSSAIADHLAVPAPASDGCELLPFLLYALGRALVSPVPSPLDLAVQRRKTCDTIELTSRFATPERSGGSALRPPLQLAP